uniref:Uncharacterized protein n=1 Tax=Panagrolaimus sp. ES5 TaxID=591445 RepID=A0AC34G6F4_9BILA
MDSSNEPSSSSLSTLKTLKRKADDDLKVVVVPSKRARFLSTYRRDQEWSLPESIIHYMAMNPKNADVYQKMIQSCKYFFLKNPIIVVERFVSGGNEDRTVALFVYNDQERIKFPHVSSKFWITDEFKTYMREINQKPISSSLYTTFYRVDCKELKLNCGEISFDAFLFLASNVEDIHLGHTVVKNEDGSIVPFEKLIKLLPHVTNVV